MLDAISPVEMVVFALCLLSFLTQLIYYLGIFSRLAFFKPGKNKPDSEPVSVIICARNESKNLRKYLPLVLEQDFPNYQVIVVNDCSFDDSADYLKEISAQYKHLKVVTIEEQERYRHGKKFALTLGIKAAQHELLLLTDADCNPNSKEWLANMQSNFNKNTDIVLSYGGYQKKNSLLNKLIRFDTVYSAIQYLSFSLQGNTYMGVGRNLAYKKELFFKNKGFASHYHLLSGDDDLFINEVATSNNTAVELRPESFTYSEPASTMKNWFRQKKRHLSSSKLYKPRHKRMLGILHLSHFMFYITIITLLILKFSWIIVLSLYLLRVSIQMFIFGKGMKVLKELDLLPFIPLLDIFITIFYPVLAVSGLFYKKIKWK